MPGPPGGAGPARARSASPDVGRAGTPLLVRSRRASACLLDTVWERQCAAIGKLVRYADDFVVLCRTAKAAKEEPSEGCA